MSIAECEGDWGNSADELGALPGVRYWLRYLRTISEGRRHFRDDTPTFACADRDVFKADYDGEYICYVVVADERDSNDLTIFVIGAGRISDFDGRADQPDWDATRLRSFKAAMENRVKEKFP